MFTDYSKEILMTTEEDKTEAEKLKFKKEKFEAQSKLLSLVGGRKSLVAIIGLVSITVLASLDKLDTELLTAISGVVAVYIGGNILKK